MQLELVDWAIIAAYLAISLFIGLRYKDRASKSLSDFFLGGRNLTWYVAGVSMVATTFAADTPLAVNELVAQNGIAGNWLWWNFLFSGMLTTFFFSRLWRRAEVLTEVEFIEFRYSGRPATFLRGFKSVYLGLFMNCLIIGWVNVALISILKIFFDIPESHLLWYAGGFMILTAIYSSLSGLWGVAITDFVQFIIAIAGCIILAIIVVNSPDIGGIDGLKAKVPSWSMEFFPVIGKENSGVAGTFSLGVGAFLAYITMIWWTSWYPGAEPGGGGYVAQRMMSCKNEKHSIYATLFFQIAHYCIRPWPWILVGLCSIVLYPELGYSDKKLGYVMAMRDYLPVGLKGLLLVAFLAAYMSTISTQLNWGASYLVNDLYWRFVNPKADQKSLVSASRLTTLLLVAVGLYTTSMITTISGVWSFIIECGAGLGLVLILRWYWWRINAWSEITATLVPFAAYAFAKYLLGWQFPDSFFFTAGLTTLSWLIVTFITPPTETTHLQRFYEKVRPLGAWNEIAATLNSSEKKQSSGLFNLFACWISAVIMTYSFLFFSGKVIFKEWGQAGLWFTIALSSFIILRFFINKTTLFKDSE